LVPLAILKEENKMVKDREKYLEILKKHIKNKNLIKHSIAVEAVMGGLAKRFDQDVGAWRLAGLLHDIDYDQTYEKPELHSLIGAEILKELGLPEEIIYAVKAHNEAHGLERKSLMDKSLYASDPLTGLIVAAALISPTKKLKDIDVQFVLNRFYEKSFARGANREQIKSCEEFNLSLEEFINIALDEMKAVADDLGL